MACVLKVARGDQIYRVVLERSPDFAAVGAAVQRVLPGLTASDTTFSSGGAAHALTLDAFEAFTATGKKLASGQVVLRLDAPKLSEELTSSSPPARPQAATPTPARSRAAPRASWEEDPRPLDELVAGIQGSPEGAGNGPKADATAAAAPATGDVRAPAANRQARTVSMKLTADNASDDEEEEPDSVEENPGPTCPRLPKELQRSSSCPAWALVPEPQEKLAADPAEQPTQDLPPEPSEVWPPTPDSTPLNSPRPEIPSVDYRMEMDDFHQQQQFVWVPVLVPVF